MLSLMPSKPTNERPHDCNLFYIALDSKKSVRYVLTKTTEVLNRDAPKNLHRIHHNAYR